MSKIRQLTRRLLGEHIWSCLREWRFGSRTVVRTYGNHRLTIHLADWIGREWYSEGIRDLDEIKWLSERRLRPGARVFDIGAHQSVVALIMSKIVGVRGYVVSIEADYHNARIGAINVALNDAKNVQVIYAAGAARDGHLDIDPVKEVKAVTIDSLALEYGAPDVLYIDVDGMECEVLRGASLTLSKHRPDIFVEVHVGAGLEEAGGSVDSVLECLHSEFYELFILRDEPGAEPTPYQSGSQLLHSRFFLLASASPIDQNAARDSKCHPTSR